MIGRTSRRAILVGLVLAPLLPQVAIAASGSVPHNSHPAQIARLDTKLALLTQEHARRQTTLGAISQRAASPVHAQSSVATTLSLGYIRQTVDSQGRLTSSASHVLNLASHADTPWSWSSSTCAFSATPSPDGTMLAYDAYLHGAKTSNDPSTCNGPESLVIQGARTVTFAALATNQFYDSLAWSPDGTKLVVTRITFNSSGTWTSSALLICTIASESCAAIPGGGVGAGYASYSPDGTHLVYDPGFLTSANYLAVMTTDGGNVVDYPATGVSSVSDPQDPSFSPDGTKILFGDVTRYNPTTNAATFGQFIFTVAANHVVHLPLIAGNGLEEDDGVFSPTGDAIFFDEDSFNITTGRFGSWPTLFWSNLAGTMTSPVAARSSTDQQWLTGVSGSAPAQAPAASFTPVTPTRLLDTRQPGHAALTTGGYVDVPVTNVATVPSNATAVAVTVTAIGPSASTDLRAYPRPASGTAYPTVSTLNASTHQIVANTAIVPVGSGGMIRIRNSAGAVNILVDLTGYFAPGSSGGLYTPLSPPQTLSSRLSLVGPQTSVVQVTGTGVGQVPSGATAVALDVTASTATLGSGSAQTDVQVYPDGTAASTSVLNLDAYGETRSNLVIVPVGSDGAIDVAVPAGAVAVHIATLGYVQAGTGLLFHPVTPTRVMDTRYGENTPGGAASPLAVGSPGRAVPLTGAVATLGGLTDLPSTARAVILNVTGINPQAAASISVGASSPVAGLGVSVGKSQVTAAAALPALSGSGTVNVVTYGSALPGVLDIFGYFATS